MGYPKITRMYQLALIISSVVAGAVVSGCGDKKPVMGTCLAESSFGPKLAGLPRMWNHWRRFLKIGKTCQQVSLHHGDHDEVWHEVQGRGLRVPGRWLDGRPGGDDRGRGLR